MRLSCVSVCGVTKDDEDEALPPELGYEVPSTAAADGKGGAAGKKRASRRSGKGEGRDEPAEDSGEKHRRMEEEEATDSDEGLTGKTARKLAKQMTDKGRNGDSVAISLRHLWWGYLTPSVL